jgi:hypothetical protein
VLYRPPRFFLRFVDETNKLSGVHPWKSAIIDELRLQLGAQILDIGCDMSADPFDLAARVGPNGLSPEWTSAKSWIGSDPPRHQPQHFRDV